MRELFAPALTIAFTLVSALLFSGASHAGQNPLADPNPAADPNMLALFASMGPIAGSGEPGVVSTRTVTVAPDALDAAQLLIAWDEVRLVANRAHIEQRPQQDRQTWRGYIDGNPANTLLITRLGQRFSGRIQLGTQNFRIRSDARGNTHLLELAPRVGPIDSGAQNRPAAPLIPPVSDGPATLQLDPASLSPLTPPVRSAIANVTDEVVQDLLVVYNQAACNDAGGCVQLEVDILNAVAGTNAAYARSQVGISLNLVGMRWVDYAGSDFSTTLTHLSARAGSETDPDGVLDEVRIMRDEVGADLVTMVFRRGPGTASCGLAYLLPGDGDLTAAPFAYNVIDMSSSCQPSDLILAHEIGHNQGADHDRETAAESARLVNPSNPDLPQPGEYQYGFRRCRDGSVDDFGAAPYFYTIMAYQCGVVQPIMYFSNPDVVVSGTATGVDPALDPERAAFTARTLNESAFGVAAFREALPYAPLPPSNLLALATGPFSVELYWVDNATNEQDFEVERSRDTLTWNRIATVDADLRTFVDNSARAETLYYYRVRARNSAGFSSYSAVASAETDIAPPVPKTIPMLPLVAVMSLMIGLLLTVPKAKATRRATAHGAPGARLK